MDSHNLLLLRRKFVSLLLAVSVLLSLRQEINMMKNLMDMFPTTDSHDQQELRPETKVLDFTTIIDVISIGSTSRLDYMEAQLSTWGNHSSIRYFVQTTEHDDADPNCKANQFPTMSEIQYHVKHCRAKHGRHPFLHVYQYMPVTWVKKKSDPAGWLCAQTRVGSGLKKYQGRIRQEAQKLNVSTPADILPDYVFLVDDDTYMNVDRLLKELKRQQKQSGIKREQSPGTELHQPAANVWAGCMAILPSKRVRDYYRIATYGGGGTIISKFALDRMILQSLECDDERNESNDLNGGGVSQLQTIDKHLNCEWRRHSCRQIFVENRIGEREDYMNLVQRRNGNNQTDSTSSQAAITLIDLIFAVFHRHALMGTNPPTHNCFFSDWIPAYFFDYYGLADHPWSKFERHVPNATHTVFMKPITTASVEWYGPMPQNWTASPSAIAPSVMVKGNMSSTDHDENDDDVDDMNTCPYVDERKEPCPPTVLICHYLNPQAMREHHWKRLKLP